METIRLETNVDSDGHVRIDLPTRYQSGRVEIVIVVNRLQQNAVQQAGYDLTDLAGKLAWKGDAVAEQRRIRDEW